MKTIKTGKYSDLVWIKKDEDFPGTLLGGQKQGFYLLWTGSNMCDFSGSEYLGTSISNPEYVRDMLYPC